MINVIMNEIYGEIRVIVDESEGSILLIRILGSLFLP